jgi:hypothetical protein
MGRAGPLRTGDPRALRRCGTSNRPRRRRPARCRWRNRDDPGSISRTGFASRSLTARSCASSSACGRTCAPLGQRLCAWLQATHRDGYDDAIEFYLAAPLRDTLGLRGRQQRAAGSVRAALNQLYDADERYNRALKWSVRGRYANTKLPRSDRKDQRQQAVTGRRVSAEARHDLQSRKRTASGRAGAKRSPQGDPPSRRSLATPQPQSRALSGRERRIEEDSA